MMFINGFEVFKLVFPCDSLGVFEHVACLQNFAVDAKASTSGKPTSEPLYFIGLRPKSMHAKPPKVYPYLAQWSIPTFSKETGLCLNTHTDP